MGNTGSTSTLETFEIAIIGVVLAVVVATVVCLLCVYWRSKSRYGEGWCCPGCFGSGRRRFSYDGSLPRKNYVDPNPPFQGAYGHGLTTNYMRNAPLALPYGGESRTRETTTHFTREPARETTTHFIREPARSSTHRAYSYRDASPSRYTTDSYHQYTRDLPVVEVRDMSENRTLDRYSNDRYVEYRSTAPPRETRASTYDRNFIIGRPIRDQAVETYTGPGYMATRTNDGVMMDQRMAVNRGRDMESSAVDYRMMHGPPLRAIFNPYAPAAQSIPHPLQSKYGDLSLQPRFERIPA